MSSVIPVTCLTNDIQQPAQWRKSNTNNTQWRLDGAKTTKNIFTPESNDYSV